MAKFKISDLLAKVQAVTGVELAEDSTLEDIEAALASLSKREGPAKWTPSLTVDGLLLFARTGIRVGRDQLEELTHVLESKSFREWLEVNYDSIKSVKEAAEYRRARRERNKS